MITYGQTIEWTHRDGWRESFTVSGCDTLEEARKQVVECAMLNGWTPPRWWQWWRWGDTRTPWAVMANAHAQPERGAR